MTDRTIDPKTLAGPPPDELTRLSPEPRSGPPRAAASDLHRFFDGDRPLEERPIPARSRELARSLFEALRAEPSPASGEGRAADGGKSPADASLRDRIVTDEVLRSEADRDQNVYLGRLFTRRLTNAVPDVVFLPATAAEVTAAFRWARGQHVPVTLRGAASTAMGGSVPNDGGLTLDLSRLDAIEIEAGAGVVVVGGGARLRSIHQKLAARGFALKNFPSNLGGTLAGWFSTGGIGLNAFGHGTARDRVRAADLLLPDGEHVRLHDDDRLDVPDGARRRTLSGDDAGAWFRARGLEPLRLADLAGSEGIYGAILQLTVEIEPRQEIAAFLLAFDHRDGAFEAIEWIARHAGTRFAKPANVKLFSASHMHHTRRVWRDEDAREWRKQPGELSAGVGLPWSRILSPADLGLSTDLDPGEAAAYLFVDFLGGEAGRSFAKVLGEVPGYHLVLGPESVRVAAERFRPQQTKRLGPGMLAAEILMPIAEVPRFLPRAERLAENAGNTLDAEVYYLADGRALVIAAYLTDHRRGGFQVDLLIAPALLDLAMAEHGGKPYVLGRWQSAWAARAFGEYGLARIARRKQALDPETLVNRGVLLGLRLHGSLGRFVARTFEPGMRFARNVYSFPAVMRLVRAAFDLRPGVADGRGEPAQVGAEFHASRPSLDGRAPSTNGHGGEQSATARALTCVNCGECNSVCPIFHESKIRLPQMLTHLGEAVYAGAPLPLAGSVLLDLCMRCGNCEEVCQAGIPHLPLYEKMQAASDAVRPRDRERHLAILAAVRGSARYLREFLDVRPGGYLKRAAASLPGVTRFLLFRAEADSGPASTCIHCGACVPVCPTHANREFEAADPRLITTDIGRCIGCGTCVEVCPANHDNGGQTLRVMEAPTRQWFDALQEFERKERT